MKILLIGEYSGVHVTLAKTLKKQGYSVTLVSDGDAYKGFDKDFSIDYRSPKNSLLRKLMIISDFLGIKGIVQYWKNRGQIAKLVGYDIVQLINPIALNGYGSIVNIFFIRFLSKNNRRLYLGALGDDYFWTKAALNHGRFRYSAMDNLNIRNIKPYLLSLKCMYGLFYPTLNRYAMKVSDRVIPGLYDYYAAYADFRKCTAIIPLPILAERINPNPIIFKGYPVKIFHGWQSGKECRKGNLLFDEAIRKLKANYGNKVEYIVVKSLPYDEYIQLFSDCHIFIDQCYSYDMGMNGLLGAAAGKVVLSGAEPEAIACFSPKTNAAALNAVPDVDSIYWQLADLIENPRKMENLSQAAIETVELRHRSDHVAAKYLEVWTSSGK
jgi:glycosyltransferase involved in cell wall biosynthesis